MGCEEEPREFKGREENVNWKSEAKHTPTPWETERNPKPGRTVSMTEPTEIFAHDRDDLGRVSLIAEICHPLHGDQEANAEFIVRACNCHDGLLEACEKIVTEYYKKVDGWPMGNISSAIPIVEQAIAKAKVMNEGGREAEEPCPDGPSDPQEPEIWTRVDICSKLGSEFVSVRVVTNDDNDDGIPDLEPVSWTHTFPNLEAALKQYGKSHYGVAGHRVDVFVDGKKV